MRSSVSKLLTPDDEHHSELFLQFLFVFVFALLFFLAVPCDTLAEDQHTKEKNEFKKSSLPFLPIPPFFSISLQSINLSPTCLLAPTCAHTHTYAQKSSSTLPKLHCMSVQSHYCACVISTRRELFQIAHCCFPRTIYGWQTKYGRYIRNINGLLKCQTALAS